MPQGSILGPILYCLLVNDLPEVAHDHPALPEAPSFWNIHCSKCGGITCFADHSSLSMSNKDPQVLNQEIKDKYKEISAYMASNRLVLNSDKTHLLVMASERNHKSHGNFGVILDTGTETILPQSHEKMLGCNISSNFSWNHHLRDYEYSLNQQLTSTINALRKISYSASFATRKMIANGIVLSRIIYVIQIWGGTHDYLLKMLQILQNKAARFVTNLDIFTSQAKLLQQCGWLSVKQLVDYHSLTLIFKCKKEQKPVFLFKTLSQEFNYRTRAATTGSIVFNHAISSDIAKSAFIARSTQLWNSLPPQIKQADSLQKFKGMLKPWIKQNVAQ